MTFLELQAYVRERLGIETSDSSRITQIKGVLNSEYTLACITSEASLSEATLAFASGNSTVALAAGVEKVKAVVATTGRLQPVSTSQFTYLKGTYTAAADKPAAPKYYLVVRGTSTLELRVWPAPSATDNAVSALVVKNPTALTADGDIPSVVPEAFHGPLIGERTVMRLALAENDATLANEAQRLGDQAFMQLVQFVRERHGELDGPGGFGGSVGVPMPGVLGQMVGAQ